MGVHGGSTQKKNDVLVEFWREIFSKKRDVFACIDVFPKEPFPKNHKIRKLKNIIFSPHRAGALDETFKQMGEILIEDLKLLDKNLPPRVCKRAELETVNRLESMPVKKN